MDEKLAKMFEKFSAAWKLIKAEITLGGDHHYFFLESGINLAFHKSSHMARNFGATLPKARMQASPRSVPGMSAGEND